MRRNRRLSNRLGVIVESRLTIISISSFLQIKKAKCLADKHLAMYAEGVLFDYCDALFAFLKRPLEYFQKLRYNNYRIVKLDSWLIAW